MIICGYFFVSVQYSQYSCLFYAPRHSKNRKVLSVEVLYIHTKYVGMYNVGDFKSPLQKEGAQVCAWAPN